MVCVACLVIVLSALLCIVGLLLLCLFAWFDLIWYWLVIVTLLINFSGEFIDITIKLGCYEFELRMMVIDVLLVV